jgi:hypothetical protein
MYWLRRLLGKQVWAGMVNKNTIVYWEGRRKMTIAGEMLMDGVEISVASIVAWDDSDGELIDESERQRIVKNVKSCLESQGARVVLN